ncbi:MAG: glycosyltransferase family 4 protein [Verrucomicrobiales bacterium]|nr:glycosyltransferase family 4 protein [Verrucomicrobiales bacterium]
MKEAVKRDIGRGRKPLVVSMCGTFLKREMQSLYRQMANLRHHRTMVLAERLENLEQFPLDNVVQMTRMPKPRPRGNFILRFWYKHVVKQSPPSRGSRARAPYYPYNLPQLLKENQPAVVHVYYGHKVVKYLEMLEVWGGPFIVSFHGVDVVKFMDDETHLATMRRVFEKAKLVLARSESLLAEVEKIGCPKEKLRLNRTPIPFRNDQEPAVRCAPENGEWRLVQACRLIPKKGLFTTVEALKMVVKEWPRLRFSLCGTGSDEERLREAIASAGLERNIHLLGWTSQEGLAEEFANSHVFLHPSELTETSDQEGIPNAMLEAMASGLPVVATRHGGIPEAVTDGEDGLLVAEKSPDELAAAILKLLGDGELLERLSARAAVSVREKFGLEEQVANLEACYLEAAKAK